MGIGDLDRLILQIQINIIKATLKANKYNSIIKILRMYTKFNF